MGLEKPQDQDIVIIGATGDLARRKLLPALYNLFYADNLLPDSGRIIGYARSKLDDDEFRARAEEAVRKFSRTGIDEKAWQAFSKRLTFVCADPDGYAGLKQHLEQPQRLIYLSIPPSAYAKAIHALGEAGIVDGTRLIVEKPFGTDLDSSRELEGTLYEFFDESQIFRIDHYLGKETVQNILVFRFGNSIFERVWSRDEIEHIQITVAEELGMEGRGSFYEEVGALRDIIQNHVFQVLSLLTMEPPASFDAQSIRDEKAKLIHVIKPIDPEQAVRAQYTTGKMDGKGVPGYRDEEGVDAASATETYAALRVAIDNWRWAGVPIFLRTGKRLPRRATQILVSFRDVPIYFFKGTEVETLPANHLVISIQPEEEITVSFLAKVPGPEVKVKPVKMDFSYGESFMVQPAEAYERLLHDAMDGDQTLFARGDGVDRAWQVLQPVLDAMPPICFYSAGTWGPREADELIAPHHWHMR
ncbi:MAG: glucose-6-phosphate dehydrogenase [Dehalococcoidia bacterium]|nr:glucose-6-phosphate dehydrogenase [Dehalococcoidia bacterium]